MFCVCWEEAFGLNCIGKRKLHLECETLFLVTFSGILRLSCDWPAVIIVPGDDQPLI